MKILFRLILLISLSSCEITAKENNKNILFIPQIHQLPPKYIQSRLAALEQDIAKEKAKKSFSDLDKRTTDQIRKKLLATQRAIKASQLEVIDCILSLDKNTLFIFEGSTNKDNNINMKTKYRGKDISDIKSIVRKEDSDYHLYTSNWLLFYSGHVKYAISEEATFSKPIQRSGTKESINARDLEIIKYIENNKKNDFAVILGSEHMQKQLSNNLISFPKTRECTKYLKTLEDTKKWFRK